MFNGLVHIMGGMTNQMTEVHVPLSYIWTFDPQTWSWSKKFVRGAVEGIKRAFFRDGVLGRKALLFGGRNERGGLSDGFFSVDLDSLESQACIFCSNE